MQKLPSLFDKPYLLLSLTALFWAGNAVVGRAVVGLIPPVMLAQIRWSTAFLIVLPFALAGLRRDWPQLRRHAGIILLLSLTGIAAFNTMLYWSLQYTTAINASLMQSAGPLLIGLWSWTLFRDPLNRYQLTGIIVSLCGVVVIISGGEVMRIAQLTLNVGDVVVVAAIGVYALYSALLRKRPNVAPLSLLAVTIGVGAMMILPFTTAEYLSGARMAPLTAGAVAALVYVSFFPSILAYLFFNRGVQLIGANRAGPFLHLVPLFGTILAIVFLGERFAPFHAIGAVLVAGGITLASRRRSAPLTPVP